MDSLESVRQLWLDERPKYERFGNELADKLRSELLRVGIWGEVSSRAKEVDSIIRKLIKKPHHEYGSIGDKSGIRVIVRYKDEIESVLQLAENIFDCAEFEKKVETLKHDQVGYLSVHGDVKLRGDDHLVSDYPPSKYQAELQVRTMAQHLWSEMSHDAFYKNDDVLNPLPNHLKRRVFILAGVVEVADDEFNRLNGDMPVLPEFELLIALERHYYKLTTKRADPELSLDVIRLLIPLYDGDIASIISHLDGFFEQHREVINDVYEQAKDSQERSAYLYQPEALMIYDLLKCDSIGIRKVWNAKYDENELELIANEFGISFD